MNTPDFAQAWPVDEVAECLPGMLKSGAYNALWSFVEEDRRVTLDEVWGRLDEAHQKAIVEGYEKEYGVTYAVV